MKDSFQDDTCHESIFNKGLFLYRITADYRKSNTCKPSYYVVARNANEAKDKFSSMITWLKIYGCDKVSKLEDAADILSHPEKHIII